MGAAMPISAVVIGYDPTDRAKRAYATGVELAGALGAELHLVTAFDERSDGGKRTTPERRHAEQMLDAVAMGITPAITVRQHALPGKPADALVTVATEVGADLIVIGNRGAQGATRALGSIATAVLGHAPCHVLVAKTA
jgi:nucleotide-binding universal stress UspA family protein